MIHIEEETTLPLSAQFTLHYTILMLLSNDADTIIKRY